jgi:trehalose/maltose hydrolase-like predicted phosphorylase
VADWLRLRILVEGKPLLHRSGDMLFLRRTLDMRRGVLLTVWRQRNPGGVEIRTRTLRLVSLADRAVGLQLVQVEVEQGDAKLAVETRFDQAGSGLDLLHMEQNLGVWRTEQSGKGLAMAGAAWLQLNDAELPPRAEGPFKWSWTWTSAPAQIACFQRMLTVARSGEPGQDDARGDAQAALDRARGIGWRGVLTAHEAAWAERWLSGDMQNPSGGDIRNPSTLRSRGETRWLTM